MSNWSHVSTEFWPAGQAVTPELMRFVYQELPSPKGYTCSLDSFQEPKALQYIWEALRTATFDYNARSYILMRSTALIIKKVFLTLTDIGPSSMPGQTISRFHFGTPPRLEFARRNRFALAFDQDENAIAALTGPIARLLGPSGFKIEEVFVRIKSETASKQYVFQKHVQALYNNDVLPQRPELLVFKATHLQDPSRVFAIAPTGARFGWMFTTKKWDAFMAEYTTQHLYTQSLGRTRLDLDSMALENKGDGDVATLPRSIVKQLLGREARIELREVLNRFCQQKGYLLNPEQMLADLGELGPYVEREMNLWMKRWRRE
ncbi:hypothetical protein IWZ01DRAFT_351194 [Phyllosticta capitalensis]